MKSRVSLKNLIGLIQNTLEIDYLPPSNPQNHFVTNLVSKYNSLPLREIPSRYSLRHGYREGACKIMISGIQSRNVLL